MNISRRNLLKLSAATTAATFTQPITANVRKLGDPKPLGIAFLGLGHYATNWLSPAAHQGRYTKITGVITSSPDKAAQWQKDYEIPDSGVYNYDNLENIVDNKDIDIVYVVTPTSTHADFAIRALNAGKHVICEKPMAPTVADCDRMIAAAKKNDRLLQIGYRLYWEPHTVRLMTAMRDKEFGGSWNTLETGFGYKMQPKLDDPSFWRISKDRSIAGALYDIGVYAVQGAQYATQEHPVKVLSATSKTLRPEIFTEVPEHWEWELEWKDGRTSKHTATYGENISNFLHMTLPEGELKLNRAFGYSGQELATPLSEQSFTHIFQQKRQIEDQALAILGQQANITPGEMGRRDIRIINAIIAAADSESPIAFNNFEY